MMRKTDIMVAKSLASEFRLMFHQSKKQYRVLRRDRDHDDWYCYSYSSDLDQAVIRFCDLLNLHGTAAKLHWARKNKRKKAGGAA